MILLHFKVCNLVELKGDSCFDTRTIVELDLISSTNNI